MAPKDGYVDGGSVVFTIPPNVNKPFVTKRKIDLRRVRPNIPGATGSGTKLTLKLEFRAGCEILDKEELEAGAKVFLDFLHHSQLKLVVTGETNLDKLSNIWLAARLCDELHIAAGQLVISEELDKPKWRDILEGEKTSIKMLWLGLGVAYWAKNEEVFSHIATALVNRIGQKQELHTLGGPGNDPEIKWVPVIVLAAMAHARGETYKAMADKMISHYTNVAQGTHCGWCLARTHTELQESFESGDSIVKMLQNSNIKCPHNGPEKDGPDLHTVINKTFKDLMSVARIQSQQEVWLNPTLLDVKSEE
ncbi:hypothetical protein BT63DRAFT_409168 [Microthyrium microscopicum]|uniref:Uncharacterized protein n=1 Tax=Microthyrium microscopicum TaxID=703497 RepID=A0A6A6US33_9PEZI|nr:hypothetical protein BT63DRAFT_409168 [Microthyrium microscopicum]